MVKKVTKTVSLALCAALLISMTACNSSTTATTSSTTTSSTATSSAATSSAAAADPFGKYDTGITLTTVRSLDSTVVFNKDKGQNSLTDNVWANAYKEQLGVTFDYLWTPNSDSYDTKWNTAIASGDIPDCACVDPTIYRELLDAGLVEDMTGYYNDYASETYKQGNKDDGGITLSYMKAAGKLYGLPLLGTQPDNVNVLFIRKDWLKAVGKSEPTTIDELVDVAKAFVVAKLGGDDTYGICMCDSIKTGYNDMEGFLNGFGAYYDMWMDNGAGGLAYSTVQTQTQMESALLKLQKMYKDGLISEDFSVKDAATAGQDVAAGKVGIAYGTYWTGNVGDSMQKDSSAEWEVITPPTSDRSTYVTQGSATPSEYIFVKKGCKNPEAVVKVVNLTMKLIAEDYNTYGSIPATSSDGTAVNTTKYRFACNIFLPWKNLGNYKAITATIESGDSSNLNPEQVVLWGYIEPALSGKGNSTDKAVSMIFGKDSTYKLISKWKDNNQILVDADQALPTKTQTSSAATLKTALDSAMLKVVMGDDISTFNNAVAEWKSGGGDTITSEVNAWYAANK